VVTSRRLVRCALPATAALGLLLAPAGRAGEAVIPSPPPAAIVANLLRIGVTAQVGDRAFQIPSSAMEPTLHCARPGIGCEAASNDRILVRPYPASRRPSRGDIVAFLGPPATALRCGSSGIFVKRIVGLPGETWQEINGTVYVQERKLPEPYIASDRRDRQTHAPQRIPANQYFLMGDNRSQSCDSRIWGTVPRANLVGKAIAIYWPSSRARRL
jgi:signal peptidase I